MFSSYSQSLVINFSNSQTNTGKIVIETTSRVTGSLTMNDSLLVYNSSLQKINIINVPYGEYNLHLTGVSDKLKYGLDFNKKILVSDNTNNIQIIKVPRISKGYCFKLGCSSFECVLLSFLSWILLTSGG